MGIGKYKYYFRKPKSEITKDILKALLITSVFCVAAASPYAAINLLRSRKKWESHSPKRVRDIFYNLKRGGFLKIEKKNHQVYISLTESGKKRAGIFQINDLKIKKPKKWDKKWRIIIFDIAQLKRMHRDALRGKLKELHFYPLQKSVWVCPFDCRAEIELLRDFFGLGEDELRLIVAENIGKNDKLKEFFELA